MRKLGLLLSLVLLVGVLAACGGKEEGAGEALDENKLVVGVTAGPHEQILEKVKEIVAKDDLEVEIVVFTEYVMPNTALAERSLDMNSFQTIPFMEQVNEDRKYDLVALAKTILLPMGIYSNDFDNIDDVPEGATFGMPNDPITGARSLNLLEAAGLITLPDENKITATIHDIVDNPKNIEIIELEASQLPKQLVELDFAAINTNFILTAGMNPLEDSIYLESTDSPYVNQIVVRAENKDDAVVQKFIKAYQSDEVKDFIEEEFDGTILSSWD